MFGALQVTAKLRSWATPLEVRLKRQLGWHLWAIGAAALVQFGADLASGQTRISMPPALKSQFDSEANSAFIVIRETSELPHYVIEYLKGPYGQTGLAEWGEPFDHGDVDTPSPDIRHVVSYVSPRVVVFLWQRGGFNGVSAYLGIIDRRSMSGCRYSLGNELRAGAIDLAALRNTIEVIDRRDGCDSLLLEAD